MADEAGEPLAAAPLLDRGGSLFDRGCVFDGACVFEGACV
jgi:hypothetical protein